MPNYIEYTSPEVSITDCREKRGILFVGRLHPIKGLENLIEAYSRLDLNLRRKNPLIVVGSGDLAYKDSLSKIVSSYGVCDDVTFVGHKSGEEKTGLYRAAKVLILPSFSENFGNVVLEALSEGTMVVASIFTPWKVLELERIGCWCDNTAVSLEQSIRTILELDHDEYFLRSVRCQKFVQSIYGIDDNFPKIEKIFKDAVK